MTEQLFQQDAYLQEATVKVTEVDGDWVVTDRTIFYPRGGGQPGDTGSFMLPEGVTLHVLDTRKGEQGDIRHQLNDTTGLKPGMAINQRIDWQRRYKLMKMHTSMHLLSALIKCGVTGGEVGEDKSRLDFDAGDTPLDVDALNDGLAKLVNDDHPIHIEKLSEDELERRPELIRTMSVQPPKGVGDVRMINIEDVDYQPCGGTHVKRTGEIGAIRVADIRSKGARNKRVVLNWAE